MLNEELTRRALLDGQQLREIAARSFIVAGIGARPDDDISAVNELFRERGVLQDGQRVALLGQERFRAR